MGTMRQRMVADHEQIHRMLRQSRSTLKLGLRDLALTLLASFQSEITDHMELEEQRIFPRYLESQPEDSSSVSLLQQQHQEIGQRLRRLVRDLDSGVELEACEVQMLALEALLDAHCQAEADTLYEFAETLAASQR